MPHGHVGGFHEASYITGPSPGEYGLCAKSGQFVFQSEAVFI